MYPKYDFHNQSPSLPKVQALLALEKKVERCGLCSTTANSPSHTILGEGGSESQIIVCGEAPGAAEYVRKRPFVGPVGQILREHLITEEFAPHVFITNALCCRPPRNAKPDPDQLRNCEQHMDGLFYILQPKFLVILGRTAQELLVSPQIGVRGYLTNIDGYQGLRPLYVYYTFHPGYIARFAGPANEAYGQYREIQAHMRTIIEGGGRG